MSDSVKNRTPRRIPPAVLITGIYLVFGFLWILFSDRLLKLIVEDIDEFARLQTYKGWFYVGITGVMIFLLVKTLFRRERELLKRVSRTEELYRNIVETAAEGIWLTDPDTRTRFVNRRMAEILGYEPEEMTGKNLSDFSDTGLYGDTTEASLERRRKGVRERSEFCFRNKRGEPVWTMMSSSPLYDDRDNFSGFLALVTDISGRKTTEKELRKSLQEKEALLKELHHRVKNNLQIISSVLSMSAEKLPEERYREYFYRTQERIISMALIHDQFYHSDDLGSISFKGYLMNLITRIEAYYSPRVGRVDVKREVEDIPLELDTAIPLGLIVNELLINSFRHAFPEGQGGVIEVFCGIRGKEMLVRIADNGVGISAETGGVQSLGFMIVEALVDQLRGRVRFDEAGGLTAEVSIPL